MQASLPTGWQKCQLPEFTRIVMGQSPPSSTYNQDADGLPFFQGKAEFGELHPEIRKYCSAPNKISEVGATLLTVRAPVGPTNLADKRCCIGRGLAAIHPLDEVPEKFVLYLLRANERIISGAGTGSTFSAINGDFLKKFSVFLPPVAEQKRIVSRIEQLFSELDKGIETLKTAKAQLGVYRQAILKDAFEGKLTAEWRSKHADQLETAEQLLENITQNRKTKIPPMTAAESENLSTLPVEWQYIRLGSLIFSIQAGKSFKCDERCPLPHEVGVAKVSAVTWGEYQEKESKTCVDKQKVVPAYFIDERDFLLSRANTIDLVGACVIVRRVTQRIMLSDKTLRLKIDHVPQYYVLYYLRTRQGRQEIMSRSTGNQESMRNIGQDRIRSIPIPLCSPKEAEEIVRILEEQFAHIGKLEADIKTNLQKAEALRQSILKKAFAGELVSQDPTDEPASILLERIRAERAEKTPRIPNTKPKTRGRRPRAATI
jgi:type I restriction enzyme S subunit